MVVRAPLALRGAPSAPRMYGGMVGRAQHHDPIVSTWKQRATLGDRDDMVNMQRAPAVSCQAREGALSGVREDARAVLPPGRVFVQSGHDCSPHTILSTAVGQQTHSLRLKPPLCTTCPQLLHEVLRRCLVGSPAHRSLAERRSRHHDARDNPCGIRGRGQECSPVRRLRPESVIRRGVDVASGCSRKGHTRRTRSGGDVAEQGHGFSLTFAFSSYGRPQVGQRAGSNAGVAFPPALRWRRNSSFVQLFFSASASHFSCSCGSR